MIASPVTTGVSALVDWMNISSFSHSVRKYINHTICHMIEIYSLEANIGFQVPNRLPVRLFIYPTFIG